MRKPLLILLALLMPIAALAWTLPVPSGLTANDRPYAVNDSTLGMRGANVVRCSSLSPTDNNAALTTTLADISCLLVTTPADNSVDTLKLTETGAVAGQRLILVNVSTAATVGFALPDESGVLTGAATTFGQYDAATFIYGGSYWIQVETSNN